MSVVLLGLSLGAVAAPIQVTVNGTPINFSGASPTEINGSVLVPLRGVFEALGASVNYDGASRTIFAHKGAASIVLPLGALTATVNGLPQTLSQPAQTVNGSTLVPLRFVAQALGAYVEWLAAQNTVQIKTSEPHLATLPAPPGSGSVVGQLTGIYANASPQQITVRVNGVDTVVPLAPGAIVLRSVPGQPATQVALTQLQTGDQVTVNRSADGAAQSVTATYGEVRGTVKSIGRLANGNSVVTLNDGTTVELAPGVPITMAGRDVSLNDIKPDEHVVIRTNPGNNLGFGLAVAEASNPNPTPPAPSLPLSANPVPPTNVVVTSFSDDVHGPLKQGGVLTATLSGTPGGKASFAIPGVNENIPLLETTAGVYVGKYTVPKGVNVTGAAVLGKLNANGVTSALIQAAGQVTIDTAAPTVTDFAPARGASVTNGHPLIYATFSDTGGVGVDPAATRITLDGTDVTAHATITPAFFSFTPSAAMPNGGHTVKVTVADTLGNAETTSWAFTVASSALVQNFTASVAAGQTLGVGQTVRFTLNAQPGGKASASIGTLASAIPLAEGKPGVYTGEYTVTPGASAQDAPVTAQFSQGGQTVTAALPSGLTIAAGPPKAPRIIDPPNDVEVGDTVTVTGKAPPGATVRLTTNYVSKALGGLFAINGSAGTKDVVADKNGLWHADDLPLKTNSLFSSAQDTVFTITAVTVDASGTLSAPATLTVRRG